VDEIVQGAGPTVFGGVLALHPSPTPGVDELFVVDRRLFLAGFETGNTAEWSATAP
jgi:hypothetical protein